MQTTSYTISRYFKISQESSDEAMCKLLQQVTYVYRISCYQRSHRRQETSMAWAWCFPCNQHQIDMMIFYPNNLRQKRRAMNNAKSCASSSRLPFAIFVPYGTHVSYQIYFLQRIILVGGILYLPLFFFSQSVAVMIPN